MEKCGQALSKHNLSFGLTRLVSGNPEVLKKAVKDSFLDFINVHTNSHGVFICGSKKLVDFINENLK